MKEAVQTKDPPPLYWGLAGGLILFGIAAAASVGLPILTLGGVLVLLAPFYRFKRVFWSLGPVAAGACLVWLATWLW